MKTSITSCTTMLRNSFAWRPAEKAYHAITLRSAKPLLLGSTSGMACLHWGQSLHQQELHQQWHHRWQALCQGSLSLGPGGGGGGAGAAPERTAGYGEA